MPNNLGVITPFHAATPGDVVYQTCVGSYYESNMDSGAVGSPSVMFFASPDCTGTPMLTQGVGGSIPGVYYRAGYTFTTPDGVGWQITASQGSTSSSANSSYLSSGGCAPVALSGSPLYVAGHIDGSLGVVGPNVGGDQSLVSP